VLGHKYAIGDRFSRPIRQRDKVLVADKEFEVVGLLKKKGSFVVDNAILMEEETMRELYDVPEKYGVILVKANKGTSLEKLQERIEKYLRKERDVDKGEEDFTVESPEANIATLNSTLFAVQLFVYIIAAISIVIGGIGIMNTMYTSVLERTKEIGIMKSIGATNGNIFTLFFLESGFLGAIGGIIGILLGAGLAHGLAAIGRAVLGTSLLSVSLSPLLLLGALLFSFVIGTVAGLLPAHQASKLNPIDALQQTK
jgi:putative ABC transport system permease protein